MSKSLSIGIAYDSIRRKKLEKDKKDFKKKIEKLKKQLEKNQKLKEKAEKAKNIAREITMQKANLQKLQKIIESHKALEAVKTMKK